MLPETNNTISGTENQDGKALNGFDRLRWLSRVMPHLTGNEFKLLTYLLYRSDNKTGICWPKQITIAAETGIARPNISRSLQGLIEKGFVKTSRRGRQKKLLEYRVHVSN